MYQHTPMAVIDLLSEHILFLKHVKYLCSLLYFENRIVISMRMNTKFWFATDIKAILFLYIIKTMVVLKFSVFR